ncbi:MAG: zinc-ribbon domain-containing protein [Acidobacteria bacterium]|nr:zinc-ribbon domain-containing protein [Acidobacteriota bacterium]
MFVLFGTRAVRRDIKDRIPERLHCPHCGMISDFRHQSVRQYFTLYFVPVVPISRSSQVITCNRCGGSCPANHRGASEPPSEYFESGKTVMECPSCSGKMRVPIKVDNAIRVTCPHCRDQFTISVKKS